MLTCLRSTTLLALTLASQGCNTTKAPGPSTWQVEFSSESATVNYANASGGTIQRGVQTLDKCEALETGKLRCTNADAWVAIFDDGASTGRLAGPSTRGTVSLTCTGNSTSAVCNEDPMPAQ